MQRLVNRLLADDRGATAVEYGLVAALIALSAMVAIQAFADTVSDNWQHVEERSGEAMAKGIGKTSDN